MAHRLLHQARFLQPGAGPLVQPGDRARAAGRHQSIVQRVPKQHVVAVPAAFTKRYEKQVPPHQAGDHLLSRASVDRASEGCLTQRRAEAVEDRRREQEALGVLGLEEQHLLGEVAEFAAGELRRVQLAAGLCREKQPGRNCSKLPADRRFRLGRRSLA